MHLMRIYKRKITPSEARYCYIFVEKDVRGRFFPPRWKVFRIRIDGEEFGVAIDSHYRIWAAVFKNKIEFEEGNFFVFKKNSDGSFTLSLGK